MSSINLSDFIHFLIQPLLAGHDQRPGSFHRQRLTDGHPAKVRDVRSQNVFLWNPYNVDMRINGYNIWIHNLPLSHKIYKNDATTSIPDFNWVFGAQLGGGVLAMRFGQPYGVPNEPIILNAGEQRIFNPKRFDFVEGTWPSADMSLNPDPGTFYQRYGTTRPLKTVVDDFYNGTKPLPNAAYVPHLSGKDTNYAFSRAALGPRYQGTPAYISQADILQPLAPIINARSDTFVIRTYGEALAKDGTTVLAKAWCEAVVRSCMIPPPETPSPCPS